MDLVKEILAGITEMSATMERHPGGRNFPDMDIVVDTAETTIENGKIYLLNFRGDMLIKKCRDMGGSIRLDPALSAVHGHTTVELFGRRIPCVAMEFSDNVSKSSLTVVGKVVGLWAPTP